MIKLSIIICTRNRADKLEAMLEALRGVKSKHSWEVLLVDNASTDNTQAILKKAVLTLPQARVLLAETVGLGAARDFSWRQAKGEIIMFTDDDCYVASNIVDSVIDVFEEHPNIDFGGGRIMLHNPTDFPVTIDERNIAEDINPHIFAPPGVMQGANMSFRRTALERVDGFDRSFGAGTPFPCEDIDVVAACIWEGMSGRFDPRMSVRHDHGRKEKDYPDLMASYDRGRGAYYTKYILRGDSRSAYLKGWTRMTFSYLGRKNLGTFRREMRSALTYLKLRKATVFRIMAVLLAAIIYAALFIAVIGNKVLVVVSRLGKHTQGERVSE